MGVQDSCSASQVPTFLSRCQCGICYYIGVISQHAGWKLPVLNRKIHWHFMLGFPLLDYNSVKGSLSWNSDRLRIRAATTFLGILWYNHGITGAVLPKNRRAGDLNITSFWKGITSMAWGPPAVKQLRCVASPFCMGKVPGMRTV